MSAARGSVIVIHPPGAPRHHNPLIEFEKPRTGTWRMLAFPADPAAWTVVKGLPVNFFCTLSCTNFMVRHAHPTNAQQSVHVPILQAYDVPDWIINQPERAADHLSKPHVTVHHIGPKCN